MPILVLRSSTIALQVSSEVKKGMDTFRVGSLRSFLNKIHSVGPVLRLLFCALQVNSHKNAISWEASNHSCHQGIKNCRVWVDYLCAWYFFQLCNFWFQLKTIHWVKSSAQWYVFQRMNSWCQLWHGVKVWWEWYVFQRMKFVQICLLNEWILVLDQTLKQS